MFVRPLKLRYLPLSLGVFVLVGVLLFQPTGTAWGQCGSQASSCKNCHEVQGQDPVNNDGTGWHGSHAFGDFCEFCHAGNVQATDQEAAHTGLAAPLADIQASCGSCHPTDLADRAGVYAAALRIEVGAGDAPGGEAGGSENGGGPSGGDGSGEGAGSSPGTGSTAIHLDPAEMIDFARQYDETILGVRQVNPGNRVVSVLIALMTLLGGGLVVWNERRLRRSSPSEAPTRPGTAVKTLPSPEDYPPQVLSLLPGILALNPVGQRALQRLLENPEQASELLHSLSRLDPDLVRRLRALDRGSRALLLALAASGD